MKIHLAWLFALGAASVVAQTPAPPTGTGLILGRVVDATTGRPLADVTVTLTEPPAQGPGTAAPKVMTSGDGYFLFSALARGGYSIAASKGGYVPGAHGKLQPSGGGSTLDLADGERRADVTIPMWRYAALGGTVVDEVGEPLVGVQVRLLRRSVVAGAWRLTPAGNPPTTDDRGVYRAAQLVPGDYIAVVVTTIATVPTRAQDAYSDGVMTGSISPYQAGVDAGSGLALASAGGLRVGDFLLKPGAGGFTGADPATPRIAPPRADGRLFVYPTLYYPAETMATQATVITLAAGEERSSVDFQQRPVLSTRVSGTIVGLDGPSSNMEVTLLANGSESLSREQSFESATTVSDTVGRFTFLGVTPGEYTIKVLHAPARPAPTPPSRSVFVQVGRSTISSVVPGPPPPLPIEPPLSVRRPVSGTDREVTGLTVALREGARIGGHVDFIGSAVRPTTDQVQRAVITIDSADGRTTGPSGAFQIRQAQFDADGQLVSYQLPPGKYVIRASVLAGWKFAGATLDGQNVTDAPFEIGTTDVTRLVITYADRQADLSGTVRNDTRGPSAGAEVVLFPTDPRAWTGYGTVSRRVRNGWAGKDGTFIIPDVPPGEYYLRAMPPDANPEWQDPAILRQFVSQAVTLTVVAGEKKVQDVVVSPVRSR
jgi:hypothetical protein